MDDAARIRGIGLCIPPALSVAEHAVAAGGDASRYEGWPSVCVARADEHPSTMGAAALRDALADAGVEPSELKLVLFVGGSRDFLPSWSVATEIMKLCGVPPTCLGIDLTNGCLAMLTGLETARSWLLGNGGGSAAIVAAERWVDTIPRDDPRMEAMWAYSDGAGAAVITADDRSTGYGRYRGAAFVSQPELNDRVLIKYGGTRYRTAPPGEQPFRRHLSAHPAGEVIASFMKRFETVTRQLGARFGVAKPDWVLVNQLSPKLVAGTASLLEMPPGRVYITGDRFGHVGAADALVALRELKTNGQLAGNVFVISNTPYASGAGLIEAGS